jgi:hypothetical protein
MPSIPNPSEDHPDDDKACGKNHDDLMFGGAALGGLLVYIVVGTIFYEINNEWPFQQALYYSLQAGFSVGFGALSEPNNSSRWYTICHVLVGSGFIAGALGLFVQVMIDKSETTQQTLQAEYLKEGNDGEDSLDEEIEQLGRQCQMRLLHFDSICLMLFFAWVSLGALFACTNWNVPLVEGECSVCLNIIHENLKVTFY